MTCHRETVCNHQRGLARNLLHFGTEILFAGLFLLPGYAMAASAAVNFSGHVPSREMPHEGYGLESVVVGFADRVLLPVPNFTGKLKTGAIYLYAVGRAGEGSSGEISWRDDAGEPPPAFLEVPVRSAKDTRYQVCVRSQQGYKKQCRAYRIVPAPGIKP